ncbi:hypothetical protein ACRAWD_26985 [Caulobacter segnis]
MLNVGWSSFSLLILITAIAVEAQGPARSPQARAPAGWSCRCGTFDDGHVMSTTTTNVSMGGMAVPAPEEEVIEGARSRTSRSSRRKKHLDSRSR